MPAVGKYGSSLVTCLLLTWDTGSPFSVPSVGPPPLPHHVSAAAPLRKGEGAVPGGMGRGHLLRIFYPCFVRRE